MSMTSVELKSALEAIIYAADEPATIEQLAAAVGEDKHVVRTALDELVGSYGSDARGIEIRAVGGGYRVYTKPQHHDVVRRFIKSLRPPLRLTMPALETLAVVAYKQPVTQPEIQEIRGVSCAGVIQTLLERRLITTAGRKHVIGRPILYRTSRDFLMRFGLSEVGELPSLKEFEALAREALGSDDGVAGQAAVTGDSATEAAIKSAGESTEPNVWTDEESAASAGVDVDAVDVRATGREDEPTEGHEARDEVNGEPNEQVNDRRNEQSSGQPSERPGEPNEDSHDAPSDSFADSAQAVTSPATQAAETFADSPAGDAVASERDANSPESISRPPGGWATDDDNEGTH